MQCDRNRPDPGSPIPKFSSAPGIQLSYLALFNTPLAKNKMLFLALKLVSRWFPDSHDHFPVKSTEREKCFLENVETKKK